MNETRLMDWQSLLLGLGPGTLAFAVFCWTYVAGRRAQRALVRVNAAPLAGPLIVLIPARNEATRLPATLDALLKESSEGLRVVVYNDHSTDPTWDVLQSYQARDPRLLAVDGAPQDASWGFGKPAALSAALEHAQAASWWDSRTPLLLLDADVVLSEGALGGLMQAFETSGAAALSGLPQLTLASWVERFWVPSFVALAARRFSPERVHRSGDNTAFLNGQLILLRFDALQSAGGFAAVSDAVLEDVALGQLLKANGHKIRLADLRRLATTRMYASFAELAEGFGKNAVPLQGGGLATVAIGALGFVFSLAAPWSFAIACLYTSSIAAGAAFFCGLALLGLQMRLRQQLGVSAWPVLFAPLIYLVVFGVYTRAAWRVWRGTSIEWRGRRYPASRR